MPEYYHVRINPDRVKPAADLVVLFSQLLKSRKGVWDKDHANRIKVGDYLGFITGQKGDELIYILKVEEEKTVEARPDHWESDLPYTDNNGICSVADRCVIILTNKHDLPHEYEWCKFRAETGLGKECVSWMPRGTQRVANKKTLPFNIN
jgi:hypothetical protein